MHIVTTTFFLKQQENTVGIENIFIETLIFFMQYIAFVFYKIVDNYMQRENQMNDDSLYHRRKNQCRSFADISLFGINYLLKTALRERLHERQLIVKLTFNLLLLRFYFSKGTES